MTHSEDCLQRETRFRYDDLDLPVGWRRLDNQQFDVATGDLMVLVTAAPQGDYWYAHEHRWVRLRRHVEERYVTPWTPSNAGSNEYAACPTGEHSDGCGPADHLGWTIQG